MKHSVAGQLRAVQTSTFLPPNDLHSLKRPTQTSRPVCRRSANLDVAENNDFQRTPFV